MHCSSAARDCTLEDFNSLVIGIQDQVYTLAFVILGDQMTCETVVQAAFARAYRSIGSRKRCPTALSLYRILMDECERELHRRRKKPMEGARFSNGSERTVWSALMSLPLDLRTAVALVDLTKLSYEQAAEVSGLSVKEIKKRLALARGYLVRGSLVMPG